MSQVHLYIPNEGNIPLREQLRFYQNYLRLHGWLFYQNETEKKIIYALKCESEKRKTTTTTITTYHRPFLHRQT